MTLAADAVAALVALLKRHESCRLQAYPDPESPLAKAIEAGEPTEGLSGDPWTIGWGTTGAGIVEGTEWTQTACDDALEARANGIVQWLPARLPWTTNLDLPRFTVLGDMAYNLGLVGLMGFPKMLAAYEAGDWTAAVAEMRNSLWAAQTKTRATDDENIVLTGVLP